MPCALPATRLSASRTGRSMSRCTASIRYLVQNEIADWDSVPSRRINRRVSRGKATRSFPDVRISTRLSPPVQTRRGQATANRGLCERPRHVVKHTPLASRSTSWFASGERAGRVSADVPSAVPSRCRHAVLGGMMIRGPRARCRLDSRRRARRSLPGGLRRRMCARIAVTVGLVALGITSAAEASDPLAGLSVTKSCHELVQKRMLGDAVARLVLGQFHYAHDPAAARGVCGWSGSSAFASYAACVQEAKKARIAAPCLPLIVDATVVAGSYDEARRRAGADAWELTMAADPLRCGQEAGSRFYWLEYGFCDMKIFGPEQARRVILWNHGVAGTQVQHAAPPPLALRLLQAGGRGAPQVNRPNPPEGAASYRPAEEPVLEEIKTQRARGYRKIVIAGQSFGGRVALEVGTTSSDLFATIAMAPGMETTIGTAGPGADRRAPAPRQ